MVKSGGKVEERWRKLYLGGGKWREIWRKNYKHSVVKMRKIVRFWCETILQNDYFNYQGREVGWSKVERRWRKDGGNFI